MFRIVPLMQSGQIALYDMGDLEGRPILVQHGLIASVRDTWLFDRLIQFGRRVIAIARPGYGESSPITMASLADWGEIVDGLVDTLALDDLDVFGISSGAPYAYSIASRLGHRVRNVFVLSGTPALFDDQVLALWPYPVDRRAGLEQLKLLAGDLFFANLTDSDRQRDDIRDSMQNDGFGIAQDLQLRCRDWGFDLSTVAAPVFMEHARHDEQVPVATAVRTASLLPRCSLSIREDGEHFSPERLDDFIRTTILTH